MLSRKEKKEEKAMRKGQDEENNPLFEFPEGSKVPRDAFAFDPTLRTFSISRLNAVEREDLAGMGSDRENSRIFFVNEPSKNYGFDNNRVCTTKYNIISFLPMNLFHQFSKTANFYFLIFALLQTVPAVTDTNRQPTIGIPLSLVVLGSMIKDWIEDRKRAYNDWVQNS